MVKIRRLCGWLVGILGGWLYIIPIFDFNLYFLQLSGELCGIAVVIASLLIVKDKPLFGCINIILGIWVFILSVKPYMSIMTNASRSMMGMLIAITAFLSLLSIENSPKRVPKQ